MHDREPIRALHAEGRSLRGIARDLGISRNTVRRALAPDRPDTYRRPSRLDPLEPAIRETLAAYPAMPAYGIAHRIGWDGSLSALRARIRALRAATPNP